MSSDLDALSEHLAPANVAHRQVDKVKAGVASGVSSVKDRVFGTAQDAADSLHGTADSLHGTAASGRESVAGGKAAVQRKARGNPVAAGLIAFGAGWLVSSLLPASATEERAAGKLVEKAKTSPLLDEAKQVASEVGSNLGHQAGEAAASVKETAQGAAASVKESAQDAAATVQEDARGAAGTVKDDARGAAGTVQEDARGAAGTVKDSGAGAAQQVKDQSGH
nr:DUF3618 domain-containing protein [Kineococcus aurantiacus]